MGKVIAVTLLVLVGIALYIAGIWFVGWVVWTVASLIWHLPHVGFWQYLAIGFVVSLITGGISARARG